MLFTSGRKPMKNVRHLAKKIIDLSPLAFDLEIYRNPIGNFSLIPFSNGGYLCYMRRFQYYIDGQRYFYWTPKDMILNEPHRHLFIVLDNDFNLVQKVDNLISTYYHDPIFDNETPYLEDGRLTKWTIDGKAQLFLTSAIFYQNNSHWEKFGMEVQKLSFLDGDIAAKHFWNSCEWGIIGRHKNWMSVPDEPYRFVAGTSSQGTRIADISASRPSSVFFDINAYDEDDLYRGNTNLIKTDDGYFTITHTLERDNVKNKIYRNHFVKYDQNLCPVKITEPFKFTNDKIEFTTTMLELPDNEILIGVTEMDDKPEIHIYDRTELFNEVGF